MTALAWHVFHHLEGFCDAVQPRSRPDPDPQHSAGAHMSMYVPAALTSGPCALT